MKIILLDTSHSMAEYVGPGRRRIDALAQVLAHVLPNVPHARIFSFNSYAHELENRGDHVRLPEPGGSTALHVALEVVAPIKPTQLVVISDGEPDDKDLALAAARRLRTHIATYYVGDDRNHNAIAFLRALAWCSTDGLGKASVHNLNQPQQLTKALQLLLAGPAV